MTKVEYMKKVGSVIKEVATARGYGKYYKAITAQSACESNWGKSGLSSKFNNYFGMKAGSGWKGQVAELVTREEYVKGELTQVKAKFRCYPDLVSGINGYFDFIESYKRYQNLKNAKDDEDFIKKLKSDGWATSSSYVETLTKIMKGMDFGDESSIAPVSPVQSDVSANDVIHRVALDVIRGKYGNGSIRRLRLSQAGYDWRKVQDEVNRIMSK